MTSYEIVQFCTNYFHKSEGVEYTHKYVYEATAMTHATFHRIKRGDHLSIRILEDICRRVGLKLNISVQAPIQKENERFSFSDEWKITNNGLISYNLIKS